MPFSNKLRVLPKPAPKKTFINRSDIITTFPQPNGIFTQGLCWRDGLLYQSGGGYGKSVILVTHLDTNRIIQAESLPPDIFAEGITVYDNQIVLLHWKSGRIWLLDVQTLKLTNEYSCPTREGWGITYGDDRLFLSDGTDTVYVLDKDSFRVVEKKKVTRDGAPIKRLNELSYKNGFLYANIWQTDSIVKIDSSTGRITETIDLSAIAGVHRSQGVLNGSAWVETSSGDSKLLITGKNWDQRYLINYS